MLTGPVIICRASGSSRNNNTPCLSQTSSDWHVFANATHLTKTSFITDGQSVNNVTLNNNIFFLQFL